MVSRDIHNHDHDTRSTTSTSRDHDTNAATVKVTVKQNAQTSSSSLRSIAIHIPDASDAAARRLAVRQAMSSAALPTCMEPTIRALVDQSLENAVEIEREKAVAEGETIICGI